MATSIARTRRMLDLLADEVSGTLTRKSQIAYPRNPVVGTRLIQRVERRRAHITVLRDGFSGRGAVQILVRDARANHRGRAGMATAFFGLRRRKRADE